MKLKILLVLILLIGGYSTAKADENSYKQTPAYSIDDKEFIYEGDKYPVRRKMLNREGVQYDVAFLVAAFERAYSGREHLPPGVYEKLIKDVQALGEKTPLGTTDIDGNIFCKRLADIFWEVPDNHLFIYGSCNDKIKKPIASDVGKNIYTGRGYYFKVRMIGGKQIGILSLGTFMPDKDDLSWRGFEEKIANISKETDALVLDLRGNHGGISENIRWLADHLYGNPAKMVDEIIELRESAPFFALHHNEPAFRIIEAVEDRLPVQPYLVKEKKNALKKFKAFYKKPSKQLRLVRKGSNAGFNPKAGYDKPIRILIDNACASACENGCARFLSHPQVKTYGTNTKGESHYGDNKPLILPNSNIVVSIGTSFREFADGRFIEKIGYAPDIRVPDGHDALEAALKDLR
ncbi:MAG: hypothetical protein HYT75_08510 [Deltaproteobacteria bacterium]|nr:hypothetical protein [Deltaproteobacteria bacterium]